MGKKSAIQIAKEKQAKAVLYAVYARETPKLLRDIVGLIETGGGDVATDLCDYLGIERRHNRQLIRAVLNLNTKN